jgi:hypothetical protein
MREYIEEAKDSTSRIINKIKNKKWIINFTKGYRIIRRFEIRLLN